MGGKSCILQRIGDNHRLVATDGKIAEGEFARSLVPRVATIAGLDPLAIPVDQRDIGTRSAADRGRQTGQIVEVLLRRGVENVV